MNKRTDLCNKEYLIHTTINLTAPLTVDSVHCVCQLEPPIHVASLLRGVSSQRELERVRQEVNPEWSLCA